MTCEQLPYPNPTSKAVEERRGASYVFGMPIDTALGEIYYHDSYKYALPPDGIGSISDSRICMEEAFQMSKLIDKVRGNKRQPRRILSLFEGIGSMSFSIAKVMPTTHVTGIEIDPETVARAKYNIAKADLSERVTIIQADALSFLRNSGEYDGIFVDAAEWNWTTEQGYPGIMSLSQVVPSLQESIIEAAKHAPVVATRVPIFTDTAEIIDLGEQLQREVHMFEYRILHPQGQRTMAVMFAETGNIGVSEQRLISHPYIKNIFLFISGKEDAPIEPIEARQDRSRAATAKFVDFMGNARKGSLKFRAVTAAVEQQATQLGAMAMLEEFSSRSQRPDRPASAFSSLFRREKDIVKRNIGRNPLAKHYANRFKQEVWPYYEAAVPSTAHSRMDYHRASLQAQETAVEAARTDLSLVRPKRTIWSRR